MRCDQAKLDPNRPTPGPAPSGRNLKSWILAPLSVLLLPVAIYGITKIPIVEQYRLSKAGDSAAVYNGFDFVNSTMLIVGPDLSTATICIEISNGERRLLRDLQESQAAMLMPPLHSRPTVGSKQKYTDGRSTFFFTRGRLQWAILRTHSIEVGIAPSIDGPYLKLPIDRQQMLHTFGKPLRWTPYDPGVRSP